MGKRYYNFWPQFVSFGNLWTAFKKAARGKRSKPCAAAFEYDLEANILQLQDELKNSSYEPGPYSSFYIHDPKKRLISAAPFRDRVIHHAVINMIEPIYERKFIYDTYANRVGKGTHRALDRCTQFLRRFKYVLPMDVRQFFPSIDHEILHGILNQTITDHRFLDICARIIASGAGVLKDEYDMVYFPGDDLFAIKRPRGLPIGNLTSQFWANVYLDGLDHFIKRRLKCRGYIRYVDDLLLFSDSKDDLFSWRKEILAYMEGIRLTVHENRAQPRPSETCVPFLGFQVFPSYRRLKRRKVITAHRKLKSLALRYNRAEIDLDSLHASLQGWINHARYGDTWGLRRAVLCEIRLYNWRTPD